MEHVGKSFNSVQSINKKYHYIKAVSMMHRENATMFKEYAPPLIRHTRRAVLCTVWRNSFPNVFPSPVKEHEGVGVGELIGCVSR